MMYLEQEEGVLARGIVDLEVARRVLEEEFILPVVLPLVFQLVFEHRYQASGHGGAERGGRSSSGEGGGRSERLTSWLVAIGKLKFWPQHHLHREGMKEGGKGY